MTRARTKVAHTAGGSNMTTETIQPVEIRSITGVTKLFIPEAGSHSPDGKACVMEMVSWLRGEPWSASPDCADDTIAAFCRAFWDRSPRAWPGLLERIERIAGSTSTVKVRHARGYLAADWAVR